MHDIHNNVIELYNDSDSSDYRFFYNAYGTTKYFDDTDSLNVTNKWGYCDQLYDFETGNYYMRARYYNPEIGRFISNVILHMCYERVYNIYEKDFLDYKYIDNYFFCFGVQL